MNTLDMTEAKTQAMSENEDLALKVVKQVLTGERDGDDEQCKTAIKMLNVAGKNRQTTMHRSAVAFGMAHVVADEAGMKKYIAATEPEILKAITGKAK